MPVHNLWLAFLILLFSIACDGSEKKKVVFSAGGSPAELEAWETLLRDFEKESGIGVELRRQPADTDRQRQGLMISLKAGLPDPDVFLMDVSWLPLIAHSGWLEPLLEIDSSAFFDRVVRLVDTYHSDLLALPLYMDGGILYYRHDLLQRLPPGLPPRTHAELLSSSQRMQEEMKGNPGFFAFVWQGAQYEGLICNFLEFAGPEGGIVFQEGKILLNLPANRQALQFMHDLIWKYKVSPPNTFTEMKEEQVRLFFQGAKALYERNWPYAWRLHQNPESPIRGRVGMAPFPAPSGGASTSALGGWHIGISRFSDAKPQAREFVKFLTSFRGQKNMALRLGLSPGRPDLYEDPDLLRKMPYLKELRLIFQQTRPRPVVPYYPQISEIVQRRIHGALAGRTSSEKALQHAEREIAALLRRYEDKRMKKLQGD